MRTVEAIVGRPRFDAWLKGWPLAQMAARPIAWHMVAGGLVTGSLVGGMMLGIGMDLIVNGQPWGWLLLLPAAPVAAVPGWLLARKLANQL